MRYNIAKILKNFRFSEATHKFMVNNCIDKFWVYSNGVDVLLRLRFISIQMLKILKYKAARVSA